MKANEEGVGLEGGVSRSIEGMKYDRRLVEFLLP